MKTNTVSITPLIILATCLTACSRKAEQTGPPPPTVVVATVTARDVPVIKEGVATLDGLINANINAQVQGYLVSRDYKEGTVVKKGRFAVPNRSAPLRSGFGAGEIES